MTTNNAETANSYLYVGDLVVKSNWKVPTRTLPAIVKNGIWKSALQIMYAIVSTMLTLYLRTLKTKSDEEYHFYNNIML